MPSFKWVDRGGGGGKQILIASWFMLALPAIMSLMGGFVGMFMLKAKAIIWKFLKFENEKHVQIEIKIVFLNLIVKNSRLIHAYYFRQILISVQWTILFRKSLHFDISFM
jgi:hypothetical protein